MNGARYVKQFVYALFADDYSSREYSTPFLFGWQGLVRLADVETNDQDDQFWALYGVRDSDSTTLARGLSQDVLVWEDQGDAIASERIREFSRRVIDLHSILGGEGVDTAMMVFREPRLLDSDPASIVQRVVDMRVAAINDAGSASAGAGLVKMIEEQPSLLLDGGEVDRFESEDRRIGAWREGIASDNDPAWKKYFDELEAYKVHYFSGQFNRKINKIVKKFYVNYILHVNLNLI